MIVKVVQHVEAKYISTNAEYAEAQYITRQLGSLSDINTRNVREAAITDIEQQGIVRPVVTRKQCETICNNTYLLRLLHTHATQIEHQSDRLFIKNMTEFVGRNA